MMKETVEMTPDGRFQVYLEESTLDVFRQSGYAVLPGTLISGKGFGEDLTEAREEAERNFTMNAKLALRFYQDREKTA